MEYLHKITARPSEDLLWNIPEQKLGTVNIIGGNLKSFRTPVKIAEFLAANFPVKTVGLVLPDALKSQLPPLDNLIFLSSTESGSFASADELKSVVSVADFSIFIGDFSKNSITMKSVQDACVSVAKPLLITRDAVDLAVESAPPNLVMNENLIFLATMPQLIKLFRAIYYPKMLLLSMPLTQVAEALHKFTLSYPAQIVTVHDGQALVAKNGSVFVIPLEKTAYTPLNFWFGEVAARIVAMNLYNPGRFLDATSGAILL